MIRSAQAGGARLHLACDEVGLSLRTFQRWVGNGQVRADGRPDARRPVPANKLSPDEQRAVLQTCMQARFADMPPTQIVPTLADEGTYLASESTFYRLLHAHGAQQHRGRQRRRCSKPPSVRIDVASSDVKIDRTRGMQEVVDVEVHEGEEGARVVADEPTAEPVGG